MHARTRRAVSRTHVALERARDEKLHALARAAAPDARKVRRRRRHQMDGLTPTQRRACAEYIAASIHDDARDARDDDESAHDMTSMLTCMHCHTSADATRLVFKSFELVNAWTRCRACGRVAHARCALGDVRGSSFTCARCFARDDGGSHDVRPKRLRFEDDDDARDDGDADEDFAIAM